VPTISKSAADRLGETIKSEGFSEQTLIQLDAYRLQFGAAYDFVVRRLRELGYEPTGRPAKSSRAILDKLRRESIRLSQIQDIAGCRIVVADLWAQDKALIELRRLFPTAQVVDRRQQPSNSYRAVHTVAMVDDLKVEIQIRTEYQQLWAELSEKLADRFGLEVKYGQGPQVIRENLLATSSSVASLEAWEASLGELQSEADKYAAVDPNIGKFIGETKESLLGARREMRASFDKMKNLISKPKTR
jgi:ppGpp synthetase/RelA/SpoT-type nucleotidyltranferase